MFKRRFTMLKDKPVARMVIWGSVVALAAVGVGISAYHASQHGGTIPVPSATAMATATATATATGLQGDPSATGAVPAATPTHTPHTQAYTLTLPDGKKIQADKHDDAYYRLDESKQASARLGNKYQKTMDCSVVGDDPDNASVHYVTCDWKHAFRYVTDGENQDGGQDSFFDDYYGYMYMGTSYIQQWLDSDTMIPLNPIIIVRSTDRLVPLGREVSGANISAIQRGTAPNVKILSLGSVDKDGVQAFVNFIAQDKVQGFETVSEPWEKGWALDIYMISNPDALGKFDFNKANYNNLDKMVPSAKISHYYVENGNVREA